MKIAMAKQRGGTCAGINIVANKKGGAITKTMAVKTQAQRRSIHVRQQGSKTMICQMVGHSRNITTRGNEPSPVYESPITNMAKAKKQSEMPIAANSAPI
jgi:hypothetical protein